MTRSTPRPMPWLPAQAVCRGPPGPPSPWPGRPPCRRPSRPAPGVFPVSAWGAAWQGALPPDGFGPKERLAGRPGQHKPRVPGKPRRSCHAAVYPCSLLPGQVPVLFVRLQAAGHGRGRGVRRRAAPGAAPLGQETRPSESRNRLFRRRHAKPAAALGPAPHPARNRPAFRPGTGGGMDLRGQSRFGGGRRLPAFAAPVRRQPAEPWRAESVRRGPALPGASPRRGRRRGRLWPGPHGRLQEHQPGFHLGAARPARVGLARKRSRSRSVCVPSICPATG